MTIHFISGLPRAGSTLLAGILKQNPRYKANIISPVPSIINGMLERMSMSQETGVFISDVHRLHLVEAVFDVFHRGGKVHFDTHRSWCARLPLLTQVFANPRVICCVRNAAWIFDSVERLVCKNALQPSMLFNFKMDGTVYDRMERLASSSGLVGFAINALREACFGEHAANLLLLRYESLVESPEGAMRAVYEFIGEDYFAHDFEHVELNADAFDFHAGMPGLHTIRHRVEAKERQTILPPDLFHRFRKLSFWEEGLPPAVQIV